jgi:hypothetical protein
MLAARSSQHSMALHSEIKWDQTFEKPCSNLFKSVQTMFKCVHWAWPARLLEKWYLWWSETAWKAETDPNVRVASWICNCSHVDLPQQRGFKYHISVFKFKEAPISMQVWLQPGLFQNQTRSARSQKISCSKPPVPPWQLSCHGGMAGSFLFRGWISRLWGDGDGAEMVWCGVAIVFTLLDPYRTYYK